MTQVIAPIIARQATVLAAAGRGLVFMFSSNSRYENEYCYRNNRADSDRIDGYGDAAVPYGDNVSLTHVDPGSSQGAYARDGSVGHKRGGVDNVDTSVVRVDDGTACVAGVDDDIAGAHDHSGRTGAHRVAHQHAAHAPSHAAAA